VELQPGSARLNSWAAHAEHRGVALRQRAKSFGYSQFWPSWPQARALSALRASRLLHDFNPDIDSNRSEQALSIERASYFQYRHYPSTVPLLRDGVDAKRHPVVIVGAGAVGLCLALGLARQGIASVLIEADDTVCVGSRAICISRRSLEVLAQLGVAKEFLDLGLAWTGGRSYYRDQEVFRLQMPHDENQKFPPMINLQQCFAEQFLVDAVQRRSDLIEIRWKTRVTAIEPREDRVRLDVETEQGSYALEADWVVACDGAHSFVRRALGLRMQGTQYEGSYVIVDIELKSDYPTERRAWFDPPSNPGSTLLMHKQPLDIWRLDYQLREGEDPEEAIKPENVIPRVASHLRMIGERDDWKLVWISMYRANALTLDSYRHGRVLFAGDAAHLVPIFGVRGLSSGIEDTHNLAWKLAAVVKGRAALGLLDSHSEERVYAARENLRYSTKRPGSGLYFILVTWLPQRGTKATTAAFPHPTALLQTALRVPATCSGRSVPGWQRIVRTSNLSRFG